jgi:ADP-glucose pyrophosphorylase
MARKGLPAKYAKMGFKAGWKAYKATKTTKKTVKSTKLYKPAKTKTYTMAKKKKVSRRKSAALRTGELVGMGIYAFANKYLDNELSKRNMAENADMIKAIGGYVLRDLKGVPPMFRSAGRFMFYVNGVKVMQSYIDKFQGNGTSTGTVPAQDSNMIG